MKFLLLWLTPLILVPCWLSGCFATPDTALAGELTQAKTALAIAQAQARVQSQAKVQPAPVPVRQAAPAPSKPALVGGGQPAAPRPGDKDKCALACGVSCHCDKGECGAKDCPKAARTSSPCGCKDGCGCSQGQCQSQACPTAWKGVFADMRAPQAQLQAPAKRCLCSGMCSCGCNAGQPCSCGGSTITVYGTQAPPDPRPLQTAPEWRAVPAPLMRGGYLGGSVGRCRGGS